MVHVSQRSYKTCAKSKSAIQFLIVWPEPANATTTSEFVGSVATNPLIAVVVSSLLLELELKILELRIGDWGFWGKMRKTNTPNSMTEIAPVASAREHSPEGQLIGVPVVEFSLLGQ